jgi:hypothetical protein
MNSSPVKMQLSTENSSRRLESQKLLLFNGVIENQTTLLVVEAIEIAAVESSTIILCGGELLPYQWLEVAVLPGK